jgi:hypothetical protein
MKQHNLICFKYYYILSPVGNNNTYNYLIVTQVEDNETNASSG